jgi:hypothetical protein
MGIWRPKGLKSITIIKLALWSGLLVWMLCFLAMGGVMAYKIAFAPLVLWGFSSEILAIILQRWVMPIWIIFTSLMVCVMVMRYVTKKFGMRGQVK